MTRSIILQQWMKWVGPDGMRQVWTEECTKLLILRGAPVVAKVSIDFAKLFE